MLRLILVKIAFVLFLCSVNGYSFEYKPHQVQIPNDPDKVDFYLHTKDLGPALYMRFGHTALRVSNLENGKDYIFNWGMFDFSDPWFAFNFFKGTLQYRLGVYSNRLSDRWYKFEGARVWQDKIPLNREQKLKLIEGLRRSLLPENIYFPYHHYFKNCSTIVFDLLSDAVGGKLRDSLEGAKGERTFRDFFHKGYKAQPYIYFPLELLVSGTKDRHLTLIEENFHPHFLRKNVLKFFRKEFFEKNRSNLHEVNIYYTGDNEPLSDSLFGGFEYFLLIFTLPLAFAILIRFKFQKNSVSRKITSIVGGGYFFYSFVISWAILLGWLFSGHLDLKYNWNILLFWPFDFIYAYYYKRIYSVNEAIETVLEKILSAIKLRIIVVLGALSLYFVGVCKQEVLLAMGSHLFVLSMIFFTTKKVVIKSLPVD